MVESTALEMRRAGDGTVGSNPTLSASDPQQKSPNREAPHNAGQLAAYQRPIGPDLEFSRPKQGDIGGGLQPRLCVFAARVTFPV